MSKSWNQAFDFSEEIPLGAQRIALIESVPEKLCTFAVKLNKASVNNLVPDARYQIRLSLWDTKYNQFFGRPWRGSWISATNFIQISQTVYLLTEWSDATLALVVDLRQRTVREEQYENDYFEHTQDECLGWTCTLLNPQGQALPDLRDSQDSIQQLKLTLFGGSASVLPFLSTCIENIGQSLKPNGCSIQLAIYSHRALLRAARFMRTHCIYGDDYVIPGLKLHANSLLDNPSPHQVCSGTLTGLCVLMGHHAERIESQLCELLNRERLFKDNILYDKSKHEQMMVKERRIRVGIHNGYQYLSEQSPNEPMTIVHLYVKESAQNTNQSTNVHSRRPSHLEQSHSRTQSLDRINTEVTLIARQNIELRSLIQDSGLSLVFALDYLVVLDSNLPNPPSQTVTVAWGVWSPFDGVRTPNDNVLVQLFGGPIQSPDRLLTFKNLYRFASTKSNSSRDRIILSSVSVQFNFALASEKRRGSDPAKLSDSSRTSPTRQIELKKSVKGIGRDDMDSVDSSKSSPAVTPVKPKSPPDSETDKPKKKPKVPAKLDKTAPTPIKEPILPIVVAPKYDRLNTEETPKRAKSPVATVVEVPWVPPNQQRIMLSMQHLANSVSAIPRSVLAFLQAASFTPIRDRHGDIPDTIDPQRFNAPFDLAQEMKDPLNCNEILFQFMAIARLDSDPIASELPKNLFLTFSFYRFPNVATESLVVKPNASSALNIHIIQRKTTPCSLSESTIPGYAVRFMVDPAFLKTHEHQQFLLYLLENGLHIDVWDSDSLVHFGSALLPLKCLLRAGREAVQVYSQLPVVSFDMTSNSAQSSDEPEYPQLRAALFLMASNVGHPHRAGLVQEDNNNHHAVISHRLQRMPNTPEKVRAQQLLCHIPPDRMNASNLMTLNTTGMSPEQMRKAQRLQAVRRSTSLSAAFTRSSSQREAFARELNDMKSVRRERKESVLQAAVFKSITTLHTIYPSLGCTEFFEYLMHNSYNEAITVTLQCSDNRLQVITDSNEWKFFKRLHNLSTPLESSMFLESESRSRTKTPVDPAEKAQSNCQLFLKPRESVYIPMKFEFFSYEHKMLPFVKNGQTTLFTQSSTIRLVIERSDTRTVLAILLLQVEPQPTPINQTVRLFHEQHSPLTKKILIGTNNNNFDSVLSTNPSVACEIVEDGAQQQCLYLKASTGPSPQTRSLHALLYSDEYHAQAPFVVLIHLHALQRIDLNTVQGQISRFNLILKGGTTDRVIRVCSSSQQIRMGVEGSFMLHANTVVELNATVNAQTIGTQHLQVNAVDAQQETLVYAWLIVLNTQPPAVGKVYQVTVPVGQDKPVKKKVVFTNTYGVANEYSFKTSHPNLVMIREPNVQLVAAKDTAVIPLLFNPQSKPVALDVYLFITNVRAGTHEETYALKVNYVQ